MTRRPSLTLFASLWLSLPLLSHADTPAPAPAAFAARDVAQLAHPWALAFLPDGSLLVTEKGGQLVHVLPDTGAVHRIDGAPPVEDRGQGGLGDIALHPDFAHNQQVYLSYAEAGPNRTRGAALARARLVLDPTGGGKLDELEVIWRQTPKVTGNGHYGHRILFAPDGTLWLSASERQKFAPAQDPDVTLGKILRLRDDGTPAPDNPFAERGGPAAEVWSLGHRNVLGLAQDADGQLWNTEMGPRGGDELNRIERGGNYGYPLVSEGDHYSGVPIARHASAPEFIAPALSWTPVISPSSLHIYRADLFPGWRGQALIGGLSSQALIRVALVDGAVRELARYDMGARIRDVTEGPDGSIWVLEDGPQARLRQLRPSSTQDD